MKIICMGGGRNARKGFYVNCLTHGDGEPIKHFGEKRGSYVQMVVERFNRMQVYIASKNV